MSEERKNIIRLWIIATPLNFVSFFITRVPEISLTPRGISQLAVSGRSDSDSVTKQSEELGGAQGRRAETSGELPKRACNDGDSSADKADDKANDVNQWRNQRKTRDKVTCRVAVPEIQPGANPLLSQCSSRQAPESEGGIVVHPVWHLHHVPRSNRVEAASRTGSLSRRTRVESNKLKRSWRQTDRVSCARPGQPPDRSLLCQNRALFWIYLPLFPLRAFFFSHERRTRNADANDVNG